MAVKTFTTGEVLTASDTNTYLNNGGLVYITGTSFTTASTVTVDNCFSSTYDHYRILISAYGNANDALDMVLRTTTDDTANTYYRYGFYWTTVGNNLTLANVTYMFLNNMTNNTTYPVGIGIELYNPNKAFNTTYTLSSVETTTGFLVLTGGVKVTNTQYTGFKLQPRLGTTTVTGNVRVYGYRQA